MWTVLSLEVREEAGVRTAHSSASLFIPKAHDKSSEMNPGISLFFLCCLAVAIASGCDMPITITRQRRLS